MTGQNAEEVPVGFVTHPLPQRSIRNANYPWSVRCADCGWKAEGFGSMYDASHALYTHRAVAHNDGRGDVS